MNPSERGRVEPMDRQAEFLTHFLRHQDDIRAVIGSMLRDPAAADDIFQDVALVLWKKYDEFDTTRSFGAWARGIAVRQVWQSFERRRRAPVPLAPETLNALLRAFDEESESPAHAEREEALRRCIAKLPEKSRRLLEMRYEAQMKLREMAERLSTTLDATHKALSRLREALRRCIEQELAAG